MDVMDVYDDDREAMQAPHGGNRNAPHSTRKILRFKPLSSASMMSRGQQHPACMQVEMPSMSKSRYRVGARWKRGWGPWGSWSGPQLRRGLTRGCQDVGARIPRPFQLYKLLFSVLFLGRKKAAGPRGPSGSNTTCGYVSGVGQMWSVETGERVRGLGEEALYTVKLPLLDSRCRWRWT